jgi:predicted metal-dependent phosphoesterase TrpH
VTRPDPSWNGHARGRRLAPDAPVDLHLHTLASDGSWTPGALIDHLAVRGFQVAAVCDHDTQRSVLEATRLGRERGVTIIPGVEMTCGWRGRQLHVLVYGIAPDRTDADAAPFFACLAEIDAMLQERAEDARQRVVASGRELPSLESILDGRPMWPFHVLSAQIKDGHNKGLKDAAELVVELGGTFTADLPVERVTEAARRGGGTIVIAHPGRADAVGIVSEPDLDELRAAMPIDGIEAHYRSYTDAQTRHYRAVAGERGLLVSCGSDSHGPAQPVDPRPWRAAWCADLLARFGFDVTDGSAGEVWAAGMDPDAAPEPTPEADISQGQPASATE